MSYLGEEAGVQRNIILDKGFRNGGFGFPQEQPYVLFVYRTSKNVGSDTVDFKFTLQETEEYAEGIVIVTITNTNLSDVYDIQ